VDGEDERQIWTSLRTGTVGLVCFGAGFGWAGEAWVGETTAEERSNRNGSYCRRKQEK